MINADRAYRRKRAAQIASGIQHDIVMTRVAARGGLTLEEMRKLKPPEKDDFIFTYRDGGPFDNSPADNTSKTC